MNAFDALFDAKGIEEVNRIPVGLTEDQIKEIAAGLGISVNVVKGVASDHQLLAEFMRRHDHFSEADAVEFISYEISFGEQ